MIKQKKVIDTGIAYITSTFNNIIITISEMDGNVLCWTSAGTAEFKGSKKKTPYAGQAVAKLISKKAITFGIKELLIIIKGRGNNRETLIKIFKTFGFKILSIEDKTPIAFNGCRLAKNRRV